MHKILLLLFLSLFSLPTLAGLCDRDIEDIPVLSQGRVKPFLVMANEALRLITGKSSGKNATATKIICELTLTSLDIQTDYKLDVSIEHVDVKKLLNLTPETKSIPMDTLKEQKDLIRSEIMKQKQSTSYKKALNKVWFKIDSYEKILSSEYWQIVNLDNDKKDISWTTVAKSFRNKNASEMFEYMQIGKKTYIHAKGDRFLLEVTLVKSHVFSIAMLTALLGIFLTVLVKNPLIGVIFAWLTVAIEIAGMTMRVLISGRAPITNMYETVLFSGFGALLIALIIFIFKKDKIFILGGLGYNILCLFMMKFAHGMLDSSISPLVPVLRDNFWLSTHVTTIILSYAALALSWLLANITLIKGKFKGIENKEYRYYEDLIYTSIKVGVVLLAAGIILGGVWADYSWGRFWGWDPKETWSLIVLLFYMAILHGKSTSWITTHRFVLLSAAGFMTVMMAWFGVNYILATGLHSYGFSEGGAIFLGSFFMIQIVFLFLTGKRKKLEQ